MAAPVLATKLFIPPLRSDLVPRQRLIDQLNAGAQRKLTLISAPAGYGKTTLIVKWLHETNISSSWLSLDEDDNDPIRFFQYFIAALQKIFPAIGESLIGISQGAQSMLFDTSLDFLINELSGQANAFVLVLDDFQVIHSQTVLDMVAYLLERMPPHMHVVFLSRTDPAIPLSRLRVRDQLLEIRAEQLRFTLDETAFFLNEIMRLNLSDGDLALLETRTEGWIASLQLAALSMQGSQDIHAFITAFAGSHHYIMDYLVEEVLNSQTKRTRLFLLQTSILDRMCAQLCNTVVDVSDREGVDGQDLLLVLERMNLFLIPLDHERHWYRYHHLFGDVLTRRLEYLFPDQLPKLHSRASHWYAQNGSIAEAIDHALAGGDMDFAIQLIEQNGCLLLIRGELSTLPNWIKAVEPYAQTRPWMYIFKAWLSALTGYPEQVEPMLQMAENLISSQEPSVETRLMQGAIATARAYQANLQGELLLAMQHAQQALEYLPDTDLVGLSLCTVANSLLGDASATAGDLERARQAYSQAMHIAQAAGDRHLRIVLNSNIANILTEQGRLHEAYSIYTESLDLATRPDGQKLLIAGRLLAELSLLSYEWNHLDTAMQQVQQSIALCRKWGNIDQQVICYVMLAQLEHVQQHRESAREAIHAVERLLEQHQLLPRYLVWVKSVLVRLWTAQGDLRKAYRLVEESEISIDDDEIPYLREPEYLALSRVLLSKGEHEVALGLSRRMLQKAESTNRTKRVIEVLILQALIYQVRGEVDQALRVFERAVLLARPEGYVRTFLDEGEGIAELLHLAKARRIETDYVTALLAAVGEVAGESPSPDHPLTGPLSVREVEVLKLIEAGCSNQEIADKLVISIATVKRHISNIYAKFGVQSRTQAVSVGRELGLFS